MKSIILIIVMFINETSFAQVEHGNGGGNEIELRALESEFKILSFNLLDWLKTSLKNSSLKQKLTLSDTVNDQKLVKELEALILNQRTTIYFTTNPLIVVDENNHKSENRICINFPTKNMIHCNAELWKKTNMPNRFAIVFHEYLGLASYESNSGIISNYPISIHILKYATPSGYPHYELKQETLNNMSPSQFIPLKECNVSAIFTPWPRNHHSLQDPGVMIQAKMDEDLRADIISGLASFPISFNASLLTTKKDKFDRIIKHDIKNQEGYSLHYSTGYKAEAKITQTDLLGNPTQCTLNIYQIELKVENTRYKKIIFESKINRHYEYNLNVDVRHQ